MGEKEAASCLFQLVDLQLPLGAILVLLDGAQQKIYLSDNDLGQGVGPCRAAGAGASTSTDGGRVS